MTTAMVEIPLHRVQHMRYEITLFRDALERIAGSGMGAYLGPANMVIGIQGIAKKALAEGTATVNGHGQPSSRENRRTP